MPTNQNYRLPAATIGSDREALLALQDLHDFRPVNPAHSLEGLTEMEQRLRQAEATELRLHKALAAARDATITAGWTFHSAMVGAKAQVFAQYGDDSSAIQAMGLKKRSERKRPARRAAPEE